MRSHRKLIVASLLVVAVAVLAIGAATGFATGQGQVLQAPAYDKLILDTTTSVNDSGLLNYLLPLWTARYPGITVQVVSVGSGQALANAAAGNCDVVIVHSPTDEKALLATGDLTMRLPFAYNYFTVVGPYNTKSKDPAHVLTATSAAVAFKRIAAWGAASGKVAFVSRGDNSGTNKKELELWKAAGITINPASPPKWYQSTGSGMLNTLQVTAAANKGAGAYTLTDLSTWIKNRSSAHLAPPLRRLLTSTGDLRNQYSIDLINQAQHNDVNSAAAEFLAEWLVSHQGQAAIAAYKVSNVQLFFPNSYAVSGTNVPPAAP